MLFLSFSLGEAHTLHARHFEISFKKNILFVKCHSFFAGEANPLSQSHSGLASMGVSTWQGHVNEGVILQWNFLTITDEYFQEEQFLAGACKGSNLRVKPSQR